MKWLSTIKFHPTWALRSALLNRYYVFQETAVTAQALRAPTIPCAWGELSPAQSCTSLPTTLSHLFLQKIKASLMLIQSVDLLAQHTYWAEVSVKNTQQSSTPKVRFLCPLFSHQGGVHLSSSQSLLEAASDWSKAGKWDPIGHKKSLANSHSWGLSDFEAPPPIFLEKISSCMKKFMYVHTHGRTACLK